MNNDLKLLIAEVKKLKEITPVLFELEKHLAELDSSQIKDVADAAYVFRECSEALDEIRKKLDRMSERAQEQVNIYCVAFEEKNIQTDYCTLTPRSNLVYKYPVRKSEQEWSNFMDKLLSNTNDVIKYELVRPHWPGMKEYITEYLKATMKLPFDLPMENFQMAELRCTIRKRKEVL